MAADPRRLKPIELCRLLNSTPLGEVVSEQDLRTLRVRAGLRIGEGPRIDLVRFVAWLVQSRHAPKTPAETTTAAVDLSEAARGAAGLGHRSQSVPLTSRQEAGIAALLSEPSHRAAAVRAGVSESTLYRWLQTDEFRAAYRHARRALVDIALGRVQTACGHAVEALVGIAHRGRRDGDRVRAAIAILDHAQRGLAALDPAPAESGPALGPGDVVRIVAGRLQQLDAVHLTPAEKARLTATLADALLRAISVDVLEQRLEALEAVLHNRPDARKS